MPLRRFVQLEVEVEAEPTMKAAAFTGIFLAAISWIFCQRTFFSVGERSVAIQVAKYFSRPNEGVPVETITTGAYWSGPQMVKQQHRWKFRLSDSEIAAIKADVRAAVSLDKPLNKYTASDLPLSFLRHNISMWRHSLDPRNSDGLGVVVISGLPVHEWTVEDSKLFWWCFGLHLGIPGAQNGHGELIGNIKNEFHSSEVKQNRAPIGEVRQYRTNEAIGFHCDAADVVGLLCLRSAGITGGRSRLASSVTVFNTLLQRRPELVPLLFKPTPLDTRGDGGVKWFYVTPAAYFKGILRTFWHTEYFLSAYQHKSAPTGPSKQLQELVSVYDSIANEPENYLELDFNEGDIQLISNHLVKFKITTLLNCLIVHNPLNFVCR